MVARGSNSPALFIPRGIGESRNAIFSFLGEWGIESHSSGNRVGESGNWGIKIFKLIHYKHNFKLDFLVLCMEWEYTSLKNQPKLDEYKKNLLFSDFPLFFLFFFSDFVHFFWNYPIFSWNFPMFGESGNDGRGIGESGRAKIHSPGNRGVKMCRVTRGTGSPGSPWQPYIHTLVFQTYHNQLILKEKQNFQTQLFSKNGVYSILYIIS